MKQNRRHLLCRGASITHVDLRVAEGNSFVRAHVQCDLTAELVEEMGWQSALTDGQFSEAVKTLELASEIDIEELSLKINGQSGTALECVASRADQFKISRIKGESEGSRETVLRFRLVSTAWALICDYFGKLGTSDGVLRLDLPPEQTKLATEADKQMNLGDQTEDPADEDVEEEAGKSRPGSLAMRAVVEGNRRPRPIRRTDGEEPVQ